MHLIWALHASNTDINAGHTEASDTIPTANLLLDDPNIAVGPLPDDTTYYEIIVFVHAVAMFVGWGVLSAIGTDPRPPAHERISRGALLTTYA